MFPGKYPVFLKFLRPNAMVKLPANKIRDMRKTLGS